MIRLSTFALPLTLVALVALGVAAVDRNRPSPNRTAAKDVAKDAAKAPDTVASIPAGPSPRPPAPVAPPPPPMPLSPPSPPPRPSPPLHMTNAQEANFDSWIVRTYLGCWKPSAQPADSDPYVARVRLAFKPDGSLAKAPRLVNPPADPALKPQAKSVMQAVQACNPLPMPAQYRPFYEQWKTKTIHFNPQVAAR